VKLEKMASGTHEVLKSAFGGEISSFTGTF
jgi:hypothetical protein